MQQNLGPQYGPTDWEFYFYMVYGRMTQAEWVIFFLAIGIGWIVTEYIKRNIVQKSAASKKNKLAIMIPITPGTHFRLSVVHVISFLVTSVTAFVMWPSEGLVKSEFMISGIAGISSPVVYKILVVFLCKLGFRSLAALLTGDKRLLNLPPTNDIERRGQ